MSKKGTDYQANFEIKEQDSTYVMSEEKGLYIAPACATYEDFNSEPPVEEAFQEQIIFADVEPTKSPGISHKKSWGNFKDMIQANQNVIKAQEKFLQNLNQVGLNPVMLQQSLEAQKVALTLSKIKATMPLSDTLAKMQEIAKHFQKLYVPSDIIREEVVPPSKKEPVVTQIKKEGAEMSEQHYVLEKTLDAYLKGIDDKIDSRIETMGAKMDSFLNEMRVRDEARANDIKLIREDVRSIKRDNELVRGEVRSIKQDNKYGIWAMWGIAVSIVAMVLAVIYTNTQIVGTIAQIVSK